MAGSQRVWLRLPPRTDNGSGKDQLLLAVAEREAERVLSAVMSEIGRTPGALAVTSTLIDDWRNDIEAGVRAMQERGEIAADVDATRAATALLAGIQGGVSALLGTGDIGYLEAALDVEIEGLRG